MPCNNNKSEAKKKKKRGGGSARLGESKHERSGARKNKGKELAMANIISIIIPVQMKAGRREGGPDRRVPDRRIYMYTYIYIYININTHIYIYHTSCVRACICTKKESKRKTKDERKDEQDKRAEG
jgi:hypothetical protein